MSKIVLAYSGGLDTSIAIHWLRVRKNFKVVALLINVGQPGDQSNPAERALKTGAIAARVEDVREEFVNDFIFPALKANAVYEGVYPLQTALARPLIAKELARVAIEENADAIGHGCTAKGNDQVRFEAGIAALAPHLKTVAPLREWEFKTREQEIDYAIEHNIEITVTKESPYSIDRNLWGVAIECGILEDPWNAPPLDAYLLTTNPMDAPDKATYVEVEFDQGIPVKLNGEAMDGIKLIETLNTVAGENGVGRYDMIENRVVGIKSREVYEAPAATVLLAAHRALETLTLSKPVMRMKSQISDVYSNLIYEGLWFTDLREACAAFVDTTQKPVSGVVRCRLYKGTCTVEGMTSPYSLYSEELATYGSADTFRHESAEGFLDIYNLSVKAQGARRKMLESKDA
jgi:argininosuccinate synthase